MGVKETIKEFNARIELNNHKKYLRKIEWDMRYLVQAWAISSWSKDPSTQTGAVITNNNRIVSVGYNGFACGVNDSEDRYNDREGFKYPCIIHCEENAVLTANRTDLKRSTLYTWPFMSCSKCAGLMIQAGVKRIVSVVNDNPRWKDSFKLTELQFNEAGVDMILYDRSEVEQYAHYTIEKMFGEDSD